VNLDFFYFDAGGGHRAAATALKSVVEGQGRPWRVRLVDLNEVLAPTDLFKKLTGLGLQDIYNALLARGWTLGMPLLVPPMHWLIRLLHSAEVDLLGRFWGAEAPHGVVSLIPQFNRALFEAYQAARPGAPFVTIITDFADYPPHFWIERQKQTIIAGTEKARDQARRLGHPEADVRLVSGMILRPMFYDLPEIDRAEGRRALGLDPDTPTGLVLFGGFGAPVMERIVRRLASARTRLQLILLCGRNEKLAARLRGMRPPFPAHVEGFTDQVPRFMRLSDFFIGKPGPGSISEAVAMGLPVIVESNAWTMPQERYNAEWVEERGVGVALRNFREIAAGVERMLAPGALERYRANAAAIRNLAVFEIADILAEVLEKRTAVP
jgi:hypothetical protein